MNNLAPSQKLFRPASVAELREVVRGKTPLIPVGGQTKKPLSSANPKFNRCQLTQLSGIIEYEASEFTFTARAGTLLTEIEKTLAENGQYLPFDPPLLGEGATLGGAVAAGLNGPGSHRFGTLRDFVIGIRFVNGLGEEVSAGGQVVKNAAGFDLPKFFVGSIGRFGILTEISFKVFPQPKESVTIRWNCEDLEEGLDLMIGLAREPWDFDAIELDPNEKRVIGRLAGDPNALAKTVERLPARKSKVELLSKEVAQTYWRERKTFSWVPPSATLVKVPLGLEGLRDLESTALLGDMPRIYSLAGDVGWFGCESDELKKLANALKQNQAALAIQGEGTEPWIKRKRTSQCFVELKKAFDPHHLFPAW